MKSYTPDPSSTGSISRYELPYPLSGLYRKYRAASDDSSRFAFALLLGEGIFRFLAIVNIANAVSEGANPKEVKKWIKMMNPPSMGKLLAINRSTIASITKQGKKPFLREIEDFFDSPDWDEIQTIFPSVRNGYAHRYMMLSDDMAPAQMAKLKPAMDTLLLGIQFLRDYQLGSFLNVTQRPRNGYYSAEWRASRGGEEETESVNIRLKAQPFEEAPVLINRGFQSSLILYPLIVRFQGQSIPQYFWFEGKGTDEEHPKYIHPIYIENAPTIATKHPDGALLSWSEYLLDASLWHSEVELAIAEDSLDSMHNSIPNSFDEQYTFVGLLGRGGMGDVYEVRNSLNQTRALKILRKEFVRDQKQWKRMQRAAKTLAKLNHPSIAQVYAVSVNDEGAPYIEMDLITGDSLAEYLHVHEKLSLEDGLAIMKQVLDVLNYVHQEGIWHRDIKTSNIMLSKDNRVFLIDFGIAKNIQEETITATHTHSTMGSLKWMAPEQHLRQACAQSDIYAAGLLLCAIFGSPPKLPTRPPPFPDDVPDYLKAVYEKATQQNPQDRYQTAEEMWNAIESPSELPKEKPIPVVSSSETHAKAVESSPVNVRAWMILGAFFLFGLFFRLIDIVDITYQFSKLNMGSQPHQWFGPFVPGWPSFDLISWQLHDKYPHRFSEPYPFFIFTILFSQLILWQFFFQLRAPYPEYQKSAFKIIFTSLAVISCIDIASIMFFMYGSKPPLSYIQDPDGYMESLKAPVRYIAHPAQFYFIGGVLLRCIGTLLLFVQIQKKEPQNEVSDEISSHPLYHFLQKNNNLKKIIVSTLVILMGVFLLKYTIAGQNKTDKPQLNHYLSLQIFPANKNKGIRTRIVRDVENNLTRAYPIDLSLIVQDSGLDVYGPPEKYKQVLSETSFIVWNPNKELGAESQRFAEELGAHCKPKIKVINLENLENYTLQEHNLYIFLGDDYEKVIRCFE